MNDLWSFRTAGHARSRTRVGNTCLRSFLLKTGWTEEKQGNELTCGMASRRSRVAMPVSAPGSMLTRLSA